LLKLGLLKVPGELKEMVELLKESGGEKESAELLKELEVPKKLGLLKELWGLG